MTREARKLRLFTHFTKFVLESTPITRRVTNCSRLTKIGMRSIGFSHLSNTISGEALQLRTPATCQRAPFLHERIPEDQWADMQRDGKTGAWTATIPLKEGASRVDFFSNHGKVANGYQHYLSSPYTQIELSPSVFHQPAQTASKPKQPTKKIAGNKATPPNDNRFICKALDIRIVTFSIALSKLVFGNFAGPVPTDQRSEPAEGSRPT